jgi:hypothetical protein
MLVYLVGYKSLDFLDVYVSVLMQIAERILARKSEYENKDRKIKELKRKINEYLELVSSTSDIYCKVKQSAKEKVS